HPSALGGFADNPDLVAIQPIDPERTRHCTPSGLAFGGRGPRSCHLNSSRSRPAGSRLRKSAFTTTDPGHTQSIQRRTAPMAESMYEKGLANRKAVLGAEYVEKSIQSADDFNRPLQELVTTYCWGEIWGREVLPPKTRSMLNVAMLTALNRPHELKLHIRGALTNGVSCTEIREVLMQTAIYCGIPAAVDAFRSAREVFAEIDKA